MSVSVKVYIRPGHQVRRLRINKDTSFEEFKNSVVQAYEASPLFEPSEYQTQFFYLDDEEDWISVNTQVEWKDALETLASNLLRVKVALVSKNHSQNDQQQQQHPHHPFAHCGRGGWKFGRRWGGPHRRCPFFQKKSEEEAQARQNEPVEKIISDALSGAIDTEAIGNMAKEFLSAFTPQEPQQPQSEKKKEKQPEQSTSEDNKSAPKDPLAEILNSVFSQGHQQFDASKAQESISSIMNSLFTPAANNNGNADPLANILKMFAPPQQQNTQQQPTQTQQSQESSSQQAEDRLVDDVIDQVLYQQEPEPVQQQENEEPVQQQSISEPEPVEQPVDKDAEKYAVHMSTLEAMGFDNSKLNLHLLKTFNGDVPRVVASLLELSSK